MELIQNQVMKIISGMQEIMRKSGIAFMIMLNCSSERIFIHLTYDDLARQFQNFFCSIYVILTFSLRSLVTNNSRFNSIHYSQERSDQVMCRCTIMHTYILHDCMGSILQGGTISSFDTSSL